MLMPKRTKYRKMQKGRIKGAAKGATALNFGTFGLKAQEPARVTARQIEAARRAMTRQMKRAGRVWIRVFPALPVSKKPLEVRMGGGKGSPEEWVAPVKPGRVIYELSGVTEEVAEIVLFVAEALDSGHVRAVGLNGEHGARLHALPVHDHGASAALAGVAADVRACQPEHISDVVHEQQAGFDIVRMFDPVDRK